MTQAQRPRRPSPRVPDAMGLRERAEFLYNWIHQLQHRQMMLEQEIVVHGRELEDPAVTDEELAPGALAEGSIEMRWQGQGRPAAGGPLSGESIPPGCQILGPVTGRAGEWRFRTSVGVPAGEYEALRVAVVAKTIQQELDRIDRDLERIYDKHAHVFACGAVQAVIDRVRRDQDRAERDAERERDAAQDGARANGAGELEMSAVGS